MITINIDTMYKYANALSCTDLCEDLRILLGQSLFYCCSGKDPSPIVALGANVPLYVYSDLFKYESFEKYATTLKNRLKDRGFSLEKEMILPQLGRIKNAKNADLSLWSNTKNESFLVLMLQDDAKRTFSSLYDEKDNFIVPTYLCNYREELGEDVGVFFEQLIKKVQYVMGHCFNKKHHKIAEYEYLGDYGSSTDKISLYRRFYYYYF